MTQRGVAGPHPAGARRLATSCARILGHVLDRGRMLSPHGVRSVSKRHARPSVRACSSTASEFSLDYAPAESTTALFGGNSNWRGPGLVPAQLPADRGAAEAPRTSSATTSRSNARPARATRSTLWEVTTELTRRLITLFLRDENGRRPVNGDREKFQSDPHWRDLILFHEYFHGDTGAGLGASHQTGWTGVVAKLIHQYAEYALAGQASRTSGASSDWRHWDRKRRDASDAAQPLDAEWLETRRRRRLRVGHRRRHPHAPLSRAAARRAARRPRGRVVLVNGFEAWRRDRPRHACRCPRSTTRPTSSTRAGIDALTAFAHEPWPRWTFTLAGRHARSCTSASSTATAARSCSRGAAPRAAAPRRSSSGRSLSGRDYHALMHENPAFDFTPRGRRAATSRGVPTPACRRSRRSSNGSYTHAPDWYRNFLYARGGGARARLHARTWPRPARSRSISPPAKPCWCSRAGDDVGVDAVAAGRARARRRGGAPRAADAARPRRRRLRRAPRGAAHTIIAGYPWFTDWGRDTFIALRGLVLARGRLDARRVDPRRVGGDRVARACCPTAFPTAASAPEYNAVDASLWFVVAVARVLALAAAPAAGRGAPRAPAARGRRDPRRLRGGHALTASGWTPTGCSRAASPACSSRGWTRKVGDRVVTPRIGKPVEVQALWINALRLAGGRYARARRPRAERAFRARFWNAAAGCLYDVVDADHVAGPRRRRASARTRSSPSAACRIAVVDDARRARDRRDASSASC